MGQNPVPPVAPSLTIVFLTKWQVIIPHYWLVNFDPWPCLCLLTESNSTPMTFGGHTSQLQNPGAPSSSNARSRGAGEGTCNGVLAPHREAYH